MNKSCFTSYVVCKNRKIYEITKSSIPDAEKVAKDFVIKSGLDMADVEIFTEDTTDKFIFELEGEEQND